MQLITTVAQDATPCEIRNQSLQGIISFILGLPIKLFLNVNVCSKKTLRQKAIAFRSILKGIIIIIWDKFQPIKQLSLNVSVCC